MSNPQENKPRVWKIPLITLVVNDNSSAQHQVHVIEMSAYLSLQAENEKLKQANKKLRDGLEKISNLTIWNNQSLEQDFHDANELAVKALSEADKIEGGE